MADDVSSDTIRENVAADVVAPDKVCGRCSTVNPAGADACSGCKKWLPGNQGARTHGVYARQQPPDLQLSADELEAGIVADLGGLDELSTVERSYVRKLRDLHITISLLANDLARNSLLTPGGRVRDVYGAFLGGLAMFDRYAQRVGMKRRAKRVTLDDYLDDRAAEGAE
jgi:ribosomal protein L40E